MSKPGFFSKINMQKIELSCYNIQLHGIIFLRRNAVNERSEEL